MDESIKHFLEKPDMQQAMDDLLARKTFRIPDGFGGFYEVIQLPMPPAPPSWRDMHLVPYDKL